jgi:uncharacterized protein (TIGR02996 family)
MSTDRAAFMAAIIAAPDDDLPRLVFADWLDERAKPRVTCSACRGNGIDPPEEWRAPSGARLKCVACAVKGQVGNDFAERAEFVRVQCEIAGYMPPKYPSILVCEGKGPASQAGSRKNCRCRPCVLRRRERDLLKHHACDWESVVRSPIAEAMITESLETGIPLNRDPMSPPVIQSLTFRRGFICEIGCPWSTWSQHAAAILAACPIANAVDGCVTLTTVPVSPDVDHEQTGRFSHRYRVHGYPTWFTEEECEAASEENANYRGLAKLTWPGVQFDFQNSAWGSPDLSQPTVSRIDRRRAIRHA